MKKLILVLFLLVGYLLNGQERTVLLKSTPVDLTTTKVVAYNGNTSDRLIPTTRDTIDYYLIISNYPKDPIHPYVNITLDTIAGVDTTVNVILMYKKFASESYSTLTSGLSSVINGEVQKAVTSLGVISEFTETYTYAAHTLLTDTTGLAGYPADSISVPSYTASVSSVVNSALYFTYFKVRLIISGNDSVGTGIKVKRVEIAFF